MGPHEIEARAFLGERAHTIPESAYLFSLAKLVRTRELFTKAARSVGVGAARPDDDGKP